MTRNLKDAERIASIPNDASSADQSNEHNRPLSIMHPFEAENSRNRSVIEIAI
jgi:hypothetical protein